MLKSFRKLVKQFQSVPEREFRNGRTKDQTLEYIGSLQEESGKVQELRRHIYAHDPDIRRAAVSALKDLEWESESAADKQLWAMSMGDWPEGDDVSADSLLTAWEAETSLAPGAYWTPVVLAGLTAKGEGAKPGLYPVAQDSNRSMNTRTLALWAIGLIGEQDGQALREVYDQQVNQRIQRSTIQALRFCGPHMASVLRAILEKEEDEELCLELALAWARMGKEVVSGLGDLLGSDKRRLREYTGLAILAAADPQGLSWLSNFKSSDRDGRLKALITEWMIALQGDASTWEELSSPRTASGLCSSERILQGMTRVDNDLLDCILVSQLAHVPGEGAVPVLQEIIRTTDREELIFEACQAMGTLRARAELQAFLDQGNPLIRTYACLALLAAGFPVMQVLAES
ncbi:MAG: hypothetical protein U5L00_02765 [Desulfovermiculus sp.]|nr:hypothetical protein [Desulfovermiculus sp.]